MENYQATKYCSNCGTALDASSSFCTNCGAQQPVDQPQYQQPVEQPQYQQPQYQYQQPQYQQPQYQYQQPQYQQPQYQYQQPQYQYQQPQYNAYQKPEVSGKAKAFGIVGFATAMFGFIFGLVNFVWACVLVDESSYSYYNYSYYEENGAACFVFAFFLLAFAIVGTVFSKSSRNDGNEIALTKLGRVFGIIAIVISALTAFLALVVVGG